MQYLKINQVYRGDKMKVSLWFKGCLLAYLLVAMPLFADSLEGPRSVAEELEPKNGLTNPDIRSTYFKDTFSSWFEFKDKLKKENHLDLGFDYSIVGSLSDADIGEDNALGHDIRFYGTWTPLNPDGTNSGMLTFKFENRHAFTNLAPQSYGFNVGALAINAAQFSDAGWIVTNLFWKQRFMNDRLTLGFGIVDITDFIDVFPLANPLTGFMNLAFSISPAIAVPNQGLGAAGGFWFSDNIYSIASIADANADPGSPEFDVFETGETFKHIEFGYTPNKELQFLKNFHIILWQQDERKDQGIPEDWGVTASWSWLYDNRWSTFVRGGWNDKGTALYQKSFSAGMGYLTNEQDLIAMGFNWGESANRDTQKTIEAFYNYKVTELLAVTLDIQQIFDPVFNPDDNVVGIYQLRLRMSF